MFCHTEILMILEEIIRVIITGGSDVESFFSDILWSSSVTSQLQLRHFFCNTDFFLGWKNREGNIFRTGVGGVLHAVTSRKLYTLPPLLLISGYVM